MSNDLQNHKEVETNNLVEKRVWDLPTRLFHWALAGTVMTGWYLGEYRDFSTIYLHFYFGYAALACLLLRGLWWAFTPSNSHLKSIFPSPKNMWAYGKNIFKRHPSGVAGHNPIGSLSAIMMIVVILVQVITGLFSEDDTMFSSGPFATWLDSTSVVTMTAFHYWNSRILLAVITIHISAILFYYFWKRENLVIPMITGKKWIRNQKN